MKFWKNAFKIYISDLKKISKSIVAIIICIGIALLPSLYAWINILACWDPYGNTGGIKVGIVNEDEGDSIFDMNIDIGDELVAELKNNKKLGWTFFKTSDEGINQCRNGNVYATIIIPNDFSSKLLTLLDENPTKPALKYYVNEKINAIAPKMTDSGVNTLQSTITTEFSKTVVEKIFETLNPLGLEMDENMDKLEAFKSLMLLVDGDLPEIDKHLQNMIDAADDGRIAIKNVEGDAKYIKNVLENSLKYTDKVINNTDELKETTKKDASELRSNLNEIAKSMDEISIAINNIDGEYKSSKPDITSRIDDLTIDINSIISKLDSISDDSSLFDGDEIKNIKNKNQNIISGLKSLNKALNKIDDLGSYVNDETYVKTFESIQNSTESLLDDIYSLKKAINESFDKAEKQLDALQDIIDKIDNGHDSTEILSAISSAKAMLQNNPNLFKQVISTLNAIESKIEQGSPIDILTLRLSTQIDAIRDRLETKKTSINNKIETITQSVKTVNQISKTAVVILNTADSGLSNVLTGSHKVVQGLAGVLNQINLILTKIDDSDITDISDNIDTVTKHLSNLKNDLSKLETKLNSQNDVSNIMTNISVTCNAVKNICNNTVNMLSDKNITKIQNALDDTNSIANDLSGLLSRGIRASDDVRKFMNKLDGEYILTDDINEFKEKYPDYLDDMKKISDKIRKLSDYMDLNDIAKLFQNDAQTEGDFFSNPVVLETNKLFPIENYGAGLTPFYTTLCLWVGALLLTAMLSTKAQNTDFSFTPNEEYIGKFMLFGSVAVLQGFVAGLGDVVLLRVSMVHPVMFVLLSMLYSLVFSMILYCLTTLLKNVGKAVGVVFLVFQISGTGGTFPIECTPAFFRFLYKYLPFTYAINGMREAVGGIVWKNLIIDITVVLIYGVLFTILGLLLKRYANKGLESFSKQLEDTKIIGH